MQISKDIFCEKGWEGYLLFERMKIIFGGEGTVCVSETLSFKIWDDVNILKVLDNRCELKSFGTAYACKEK